MQVKHFVGKVSSVSYSSKTQSFVVSSGNQVVIVGESLMKNIAQSNGLSLGSLLRSLKSSTIDADIVSVLKGEQARDSRNNVALDKMGNPIIYNKDHTRYQNISFTLSESRLKDIEIAEAIGSAMSMAYAMPSLPTPTLSEGRVEEPLTEDIQTIETTQEPAPSLADIANSMTTEEPVSEETSQA
jgi:hypothetical protein